jgi:hypothetical protein
VGIATAMANPLRIYGCQMFWTFITKKYSSTLGVDFLTQLLGRSKSFLLMLSTTMMVLEGSMLTNVGFLGHLSPGAMGMGFLKGL